MPSVEPLELLSDAAGVLACAAISAAVRHHVRRAGSSPPVPAVVYLMLFAEAVCWLVPFALHGQSRFAKVEAAWRTAMITSVGPATNQGVLASINAITSVILNNHVIYQFVVDAVVFVTGVGCAVQLLWPSGSKQDAPESAVTIKWRQSLWRVVFLTALSVAAALMMYWGACNYRHERFSVKHAWALASSCIHAICIITMAQYISERREIHQSSLAADFFLVFAVVQQGFHMYEWYVRASSGRFTIIHALLAYVTSLRHAVGVFAHVVVATSMTQGVAVTGSIGTAWVVMTDHWLLTSLLCFVSGSSLVLEDAMLSKACGAVFISSLLMLLSTTGSVAVVAVTIAYFVIYLRFSK